ncbi:Lysine decarboxylase family [Granulibacter bethesdensis]|uniref:Cytokinin riboside 5'-monophosphate phosphoribohydrolase n=2 Tax=Granulibacter bethesdensis TaxID=364410 RepID=A0AAN0RC90_9PROT|nr:Lysine decarboxylase family [Granulibacter bethesdensis]
MKDAGMNGLPLTATPHPTVKAVAVFCGSRTGNRPVWYEASLALGRGLAKAGITLIYGGGKIGLMGAVTNGVLAEGGRVTGVIPDFLRQKEVMHEKVMDMIVTDSMHTRKRHMFDLADAFVTMPGGLGTFDETFEIVTWRQLGLHDKPILICNIDGWADALIKVLDTAIEDGFADASCQRLYEVVPDVSALLDRLQKMPEKENGDLDRL